MGGHQRVQERHVGDEVERIPEQRGRQRRGEHEIEQTRLGLRPNGDVRAPFAHDGLDAQAAHGHDEARVVVSVEALILRGALVEDFAIRVAQDEREIHQERLAVLGEVAAVVAHELNNPLAAINMFAQMIATKLPEDSDLREDVSIIERNTQTCSRTIRELLDYATGATPHMVCSEIHAILEDTLTFLRPLARRSGVQIEIDSAPQEAYVMGDEVQIRQIFVNLIVNAIQAVDAAGGAGHVSVRSVAEDGLAIVHVTDDGPGIPREVQEKIFRPFFTTKERGEGTGLGLPTARRIDEMHGGGLELVHSDGSGTVFRVRLRLQPEDAA